MTAATRDQLMDRALGMIETVPARLANAEWAVAPYLVASIRNEVRDLLREATSSRLPSDVRMGLTESLRWCEYSLGRTIREGQRVGKVAPPSQSRGGRTIRDLPKATEIIGGSDYLRQQIYLMSDGISPEKFEEALVQARAEGDLSRENMTRKTSGLNPVGTPSRANRAAQIRALANDGISRREVALRMGLARNTVSTIARDYGITFRTDQDGRIQNRADSSRIVRETVRTLEDLLMGLPLVRFSDLNPTEAEEWTASLTQSLRTLTRFNHKIKEAVQ